ncbi:unnamed protein product [Miscanthus lutarioriparius]|uniref:RING-type E3 ubiquitin transferase n=1 Tax=Miscanthus lutarioriparius TaxID=422564 RepID=A0A811Q5Q1_9POAL|nr:unnamed protein product [Miscanthus lutarioriparius]
MLNLYPRQQLQARNAAVGGGDKGVDELDGGYNPFYGIAVVCLSIFLFCVLAASVTIWKALAVAALAALLLGVGGCFAPKGWFRRSTTGRGRGASASAELVVTVRATAGPARPGYACAQVVDAPPAFAFQCSPIKADDGWSEPAAAAASSSVVCSVCLEDVRGGEMVRQVPACRHIFHVGCIDMWLHSHGKCPMCRCVVSPPFKAVTTSRAAAEAPESSADDELPPV